MNKVQLLIETDHYVDFEKVIILDRDLTYFERGV